MGARQLRTIGRHIFVGKGERRGEGLLGRSSAKGEQTRPSYRQLFNKITNKIRCNTPKNFTLKQKVLAGVTKLIWDLMELMSFSHNYACSCSYIKIDKRFIQSEGS